MKSFAGYVCMEPINGIILSSTEQNRINRDFINNKLNSNYFMYVNENTIKKKSIILISLLKNKKIKGIVFISTFHLPETLFERLEIYKLCIKFKKKLFFVFENITFKNKQDISNLEDFLIFKNEHFTKVTTNLKKDYEFIIDKNWSFI